MAVYNFSPVPAWGQAGSFARIGAKKSTTFPCTLPGGGSATVVQGGTTKVGYVESDATGLIPAFTTTDIPSVVVDFGIGQLTIHSLEAISAGASSAAAAASSATDAANSASNAANSATAAAASAVDAGNKVPKGTIVLDVADYGATGDGSTDDTAAIQSALTAARAAGARLRFGFGKTYVVSGTLNPTGVRIEGFGATIKLKAGITASFNVFQPTAAFTAEDLRIDLNKANTTDPGANSQGIGIYLFNAAGWTGVARLRGVEVINGYQPGLRFQTTTAATDPTDAALNLSRAHLEGVVVDGCKYGIWMQNTRGIVIEHPEVSGTVADGIWDYFSNGNQIIGGRVSGAGGHNIVTQYSHGFEANGVQSTGATMSGICVGGGLTTINNARNFRILGCQLRGNTQHGVTVDPTKTGSATTPQAVYGTITGNVADGNGLHGYYLHNCKHATVTGNVATGHTANTTSGGLAMDSLGVAASGNTLIGNNYGMKFLGNVAGYGSHEIGRNVVSGNVTSDYYFDPHGADNTALDLAGSGVPTLAAPNGATYRRVDGAAGSTFYVREAGSWVAK